MGVNYGSNDLLSLGNITIDNINIIDNTISSQNSNGDIILSPNGTGKVRIGSNEVVSGLGSSNITTLGTITSGTWNGANIAVARGGTGANEATTARTNLGIRIGTDVQSYSALLGSIAGATYTGSTSTTTLGTITSGTWNGANIAVANGGTGANEATTARTNLGIRIGTDVQSYSALLGSVAGATYTGSTGTTTVGTITAGTWSGANIAVLNGGTGANEATTARTNLGVRIGTDVQSYSALLGSVALNTYTGSTSRTTLGTITTGTWNGANIAVSNGGTGANEATTARTNLGVRIGTDVQAYSALLGSVAGATYTGSTSTTTVGTIATGTWTGANIAVTRGGTGANEATTARTNLGVAIGTNVQAYSALLGSVAGATYTGSTSTTTVGTITAGTWNGGVIYASSIQNTAIGNVTANSGSFTTLTANGSTTLTQNANSTSTNTGTLVVTGGMGLSGNINIGGSVNRLTGNTASTSTSTGTLVVTGGIGISGNFNSSGRIVTTNQTGFDVDPYDPSDASIVTGGAVHCLRMFAAARIVSDGSLSVEGDANIGGGTETASTSTSTGSLVVYGGVGISGNVNIGDSFNGTKVSNIPAAVNLYLFQNFK